MAWVQQAHSVIYRFRDNDGAESTCALHLAVGVPLDTALSFAAALRPLVAALSDAALITYNLVIKWVETTPGNPDATSRVSRDGVFLFLTSNIPEERYILALPSIRSDLVRADGDFAGIQLDSEAADVAAFTAAMIAGLDGVRPVAPWAFHTDISGSTGTWGGGGSWGSWGGGGGSTGPWGGISGITGTFDTYEWLLDYWQGPSAMIHSFILAYLGRSDERLRIPDRRI